MQTPQVYLPVECLANPLASGLVLCVIVDPHYWHTQGGPRTSAERKRVKPVEFT